MSSEEAETLYCPKCGEPNQGAYALLGHIFTNHWVVDEGEVGGDV